MSKPQQKVVNSLPKARVYLELLRGDIVFLEEGVYICHFVDDFSGMSFGGAIFDKKPKSVAGVIVANVFTQPCPPKKIIFDNGGEFINDAVLELLEGHGVEVLSTAARAPWTHAGVERHHVPLLEKMRAVKQSLGGRTDWVTTVRQCIAAKNRMMTHRGMSPVGIVYGILGVNLPDTLRESVSEGRPYEEMSDFLRMQKETFAKAHELWYSRDVREKINRALRNNLRKEGPMCRFGDMVWFWREDTKLSTGWRGPARVIGRERGTLVLIYGGHRVMKTTDRLVRLANLGDRDEKDLYMDFGKFWDDEYDKHEPPPDLLPPPPTGKGWGTLLIP
jgi:hypothetical protein